MSTVKTEGKSAKDINITDLNADCIRKICSNLNMVDKINFILASDRIDNTLCRDIDLSQIMTRIDTKRIKEFLSRAGPHIRKLHYEESSESLDSAIEIIFHAGKCCPNIQQVYFIFPGDYYSYDPDEDSLCPGNLIVPFKEMQILQLKFCDLTDANLKKISTFSHLKHLDLSFSNVITGKYLDNLKNLAHLNLTLCENFESEHFIAICTANKFKELSILGCSKLNNSAIDALIETQSDLEIILFGENENADVKRVCQLKNLKYLHFINPAFNDTCLNVFAEAVRFQNDLMQSVVYRGAYEDDRVPQEALKVKDLKKLVIDSVCITNELFQKIARNCNQIEELHLSIASADNISGHLILELVKNLQHLKIFHTAFCPAMDVTLFHEIVAVIKRRKSVPLEIIFCNSNIPLQFLKTEEYLKSKDFVLLTFDGSYPQDHEDKYFGSVCQTEYDFDELIILEKYTPA